MTSVALTLFYRAINEPDFALQTLQNQRAHEDIGYGIDSLDPDFTFQEDPLFDFYLHLKNRLPVSDQPALNTAIVEWIRQGLLSVEFMSSFLSVNEESLDEESQRIVEKAIELLS